MLAIQTARHLLGCNAAAALRVLFALLVRCHAHTERLGMSDLQGLESYSLQLQGIGHLAHCAPTAILITEFTEPGDLPDMVANAFGLQPDNSPVFLKVTKEYEEQEWGDYGGDGDSEDRQCIWVEGGQIDVRTIVLSVQRYLNSGQKRLCWTDDTVGVDSTGPILAREVSKKKRSRAGDGVAKGKGRGVKQPWHHTVEAKMVRWHAR